MFFVSFVLLSMLGYFVMAVLAVTPRTHAFRVALWPVVTLFAWRAAATAADMSPSQPDRKSCNVMFIASMYLATTRTFGWVLTKEQLVRNLHSANGSRSILMDALDLATTFRGYGWDWSHGARIPPETRPTSHRKFIFHVSLSAAFHVIIYSSLCNAIWSFSPTGLGAPSGGSIFDEALPFCTRYFHSSVITLFATTVIYTAFQTCYDACTIVGVLIFGQDPVQWPPAFDAPWRATSLRDFWGRRWHQFFRHIFLMHGGYQLSFLLGMPGLLVGSFLSSGLLHHLFMTLFNDGLEPWRLLAGFGMMAPGIISEWAFKRLTGKEVGGAVGWVWTWVWLLLWGNVIIDAFARSGGLGHVIFVGKVVALTGQEVVQRLVTHFCASLHVK